MNSDPFEAMGLRRVARAPDAPTLLDRWRKYAADGAGVTVNMMPTRPHLRIRAGYIYPNGETVEIFIDAETGAMTDFAGAAHWLLSACIDLPAAMPIGLMPEGVRADGCTLSLEPRRGEWIPSDARRLAHACMVLAWAAWAKVME